MERVLRPILIRRGKILLGPMRGLRFPGGSRGTLLGTYEEEVHDLLSRSLHEAHVFYDVGAHHGYFSLLSSKLVNATGHVYSFEPLPHNVKRLHKVIAANKLTNLTPVAKAVSDRCANSRLFTGNDNDYRPSLYPWKGHDHVMVETVTLDSFAETHPSPDFVKMDVEGAELQALRGANQLLGSSHAPKIVVEVHGHEVHHGVKDLLEEHGFTVQSLTIDPERPYPHHVLALPGGR